MEAVKLLERVVAIRTEVLAEDHPDRLASQHTLAIAYQANGQVKEAVKLLEHVIAIRTEVLAEVHPSRLASQHALAITYQANGQVMEAVKLLERVVGIQAEVLADDHPDRRVSERVLAGIYEDLLKRSETRQASASSVESLVAEDKDRCQFNQAPELPQAISDSSIAFSVTPDQSPADQEPKWSNSSKKSLLVRRLKGILKKDK
jgi:tetratricopeptide (TPR) repeat protein